MLSIGFGALWHLVNAALAGVIGVGLLVWLLGPRPHPVAAMALGFVYGLSVEVLALNLVVNAIDDPNVVYQALPQWGWWVGHAAFGATLGLTLAQRERA